MSDARMVNRIAWWLHPDCLDVDSEEDYVKAAERIVRLVRDHDKRLARRAAADGSKGSATAGG